jgi:hypothetical protein
VQARVKLNIFCAELPCVDRDFDLFGHKQLQIDVGTRELDISIRADFISDRRPAIPVDFDIGLTFRTCLDTGLATPSTR